MLARQTSITNPNSIIVFIYRFIFASCLKKHSLNCFVGNPKLDLKNLSHSIIDIRKANKVKSSYFVCLIVF